MLQTCKAITTKVVENSPTLDCRDLPKYKVKSEGEDDTEAEFKEEKPLSDEFSEKTNQLLDYIEKTYLQGMLESDASTKNIMEKLKLAENSEKVDIVCVSLLIMLLKFLRTGS